MPTAFREITSSQWMVEVPCPRPGPCALELADGQTGGVIARAEGEVSGGVARFIIPPLAIGLVRVIIRSGTESYAGLCRVPSLDNASGKSLMREEELAIPLDAIRRAMPGLLVGDIKRRIGTAGLAVSERSPLFAAVSERVANVASCRLVGISNGSFRFVCEVRA